MSPANVVLKLQAREGNAEFFNELVELCTVVIQACRWVLTSADVRSRVLTVLAVLTVPTFLRSFTLVC